MEEKAYTYTHKKSVRKLSLLSNPHLTIYSWCFLNPETWAYEELTLNNTITFSRDGMVKQVFIRKKPNFFDANNLELNQRAIQHIINHNTIVNPYSACIFCKRASQNLWLDDRNKAEIATTFRTGSYLESLTWVRTAGKYARIISS